MAYLILANSVGSIAFPLWPIEFVEVISKVGFFFVVREGQIASVTLNYLNAVMTR